MMKAKKIQAALWISFLGMALCFAQGKKSKGDVFFFQYEYQKAVAAYEADLAQGTLTEQQFLNLADAYFKTHNFKKASEAYLELFKKDTLLDSHRYNRMLQSLSKTADPERKQAFLTTMAAKFPKELMENREFNEQMLAKASEGTELDYEIFNLSVNSPQTDFAPTFYKDKLLFSSGRIQGKGARITSSKNDIFHFSAPKRAPGDRLCG